MQLISCHNGRLFTSAALDDRIAHPSVFRTGLDALDELLPHGGLLAGAVHEVLWQPGHRMPRFFAAIMARAALGSSRAIIWCDPDRELYPPALAALGIPLQQLYRLDVKTPRDQAWAVAECMRCRGVAVTIARVDRLSPIEARRLQLAAEGGGGLGILLRPMIMTRARPVLPQIYAAATRWLVGPARGQRTVQRWKVQLVHGHGGRVGKTVILEHHRENFTTQAHLLREAVELADRPVGAVA
jgi:protein ImuA